MTTLKVEILGTGCKKCQQLEANAKEAIAKPVWSLVRLLNSFNLGGDIPS